MVISVSVPAQNRMVLALTALRCAFFYCCNASTTRSGGHRNCFQAAEMGNGVARPSTTPEERGTPSVHPKDQACQRGSSANADGPGAILPTGPAMGIAASTGLCHVSWSDMRPLHSSPHPTQHSFIHGSGQQIYPCAGVWEARLSYGF